MFNPEAEEATSNPQISLDLLFEKDGCKVYRFFDMGKSVYWTTCPGKTTSSLRQFNPITKTFGYVETTNETVANQN